MMSDSKAMIRAWGVLSVLTIASAVFAENISDRLIVYLAAFGIAILKGQIIATSFMEVGLAKPIWRSLYRTWILLIGLILLAGYYFAPHT
jgi:hypothetical protein